MKRLYNKQERFNKAGLKATQEFADLVKPFIKNLLDKGFSANDIEHMCSAEIQIKCIFGRLERESEFFNKKRKRLAIDK